MQRYDIDVLHEEGRFITLMLTISPRIGLKEHYGGLRNTKAAASKDEHCKPNARQY